MTVTKGTAVHTMSPMPIKLPGVSDVETILHTLDKKRHGC
jgi:hypothetical protein